jgi:hypothetical protein
MRLQQFAWFLSSKLRVAGSNPAGVATSFNDLAVVPHPVSCRGMSRKFSLRFNDSQQLPASPRDMNATWSTSFAARVRRTSRAHFQPFARYSPEAFSIIGFRPASIIFGFSGLQMM